jgi:hypothetical protein
MVSSPPVVTGWPLPDRSTLDFFVDAALDETDVHINFHHFSS